MGAPPLPSAPNFNPNSFGRLATDRYDFEKHLDGYSGFHHLATQIDLSPSISVNGSPTSTVQACLQAINALVPQVVPNATLGAPGLIQLAGDLGGLSTSATNPKVGGLQGRPVSTLTPNTNDVLTWNGSAWIPSAASSSPTLSSLTVSGATTLNSLVATNGFTLSGTTSSSLASSGGQINISANTNIVETANNISMVASTAIIMNAIITSITGIVSMSSNLTVNGNSTLGDSSFSRSLTINSHTTVNNDIIFNSTTTAANVLGFSGNGRILNPALVLPNSNLNIDIRQLKSFQVPPTNTANRTYTITPTGLVDGDWFEVCNLSDFSAIFTGVQFSGSSVTIDPHSYKKFSRISGSFRTIAAG